MSANPAPGAPSRPFHRPILVALLAILIGSLGALVVVGGIILALGLGLLGGLAFGAGGAVIGAAFGAIVIAAGAVMLISAMGLWGMRSWAWWLALIVVVLVFFGAGLFGKVGFGLLLVYMIAVRKSFNQ